MNFDIWVFLETLSRKVQFDYNLERITGTLHVDICAFMTISRQVLLRMRNVLGKSCIKKSRNFMLNKVSPKPYRLWDNVEKRGTARQATDDNITRDMRFACWVPKATETHSEYFIFIIASVINSVWSRKMFYCSTYTNWVTKKKTYLRSVLPNCTSEKDHDQTNIILFQCSQCMQCVEECKLAGI
jgi:hypothetical protein